jgi:hypothetical protein
MPSSRLLVVVVILQVLILLTLWGGRPRTVAPAHGQIPDAGAQRLQMIEELRGANERIDRLGRLLESGNLQVRSVSPDENR